MGCNCKNKKSRTQISELKKQEIIEQQTIAIEGILEIEKLIDEINTNTEARSKVSDFMYRTFGETIVNYCDAPCRKRLLSRIEKLKMQVQGN